MTVQLSAALKGFMMDAFETYLNGGSQTPGSALPVIKLWSGTKPANTSSADSGTLLATYTLAADFMATASGGSKTFSGLPLTASAVATNTIGYYRLYAAGGTTCHEQGTVTATGGGGDMTVDNPSVTSGQAVNITSWSKNMDAHN